MIEQLIDRWSTGTPLTEEESFAAVSELVSGQVDPLLAASFLTALRVRGETADEIVGAARALRKASLPAPVARRGVVDTCGTGGASAPSFNVSTAVAIVASACGIAVAKHGNRSFSSASGSADVLTSLGVKIEARPEIVLDCLDEIGLAFFFAPIWHPAMKHVAPVRRQLRFRTLFNLVGPLANPVAVDYQLLGVGRPEWMEKMAHASARLGIQRAAIVCSDDGHDEVSLSGTTRVLLATTGECRKLQWKARDFGLAEISASELSVRSPEESAEMIRAVLAGVDGPATDVVLANVAALLWVVEPSMNLAAGVERARQAIAAGEAEAQLDRLVLRTNQDGPMQ